jgi:hypothetical protein
MVSWITFHQKDVREDPAGFRMIKETIDVGGGREGRGRRGGRGGRGVGGGRGNDFMQLILLPPSFLDHKMHKNTTIFLMGFGLLNSQ